MKKYKLEDLFELQMGKTPSRNISDYWCEGVYDWISIRDLSNSEKYISETKEKLSKIAIEKSGIKPIPENTLVMSFKLSIGKVAITSSTMYSNEAIMAFHDKGVENILTEYLYYNFLSKDWSVGSNKAVMGITLNKATLSNVEINLHDIQEQERIVSILNKCDRLISLKKDELEELDTLIKSRFVEMFGMPHERRFKTKTLPEIIASDKDALKRGPFGGSLKKDDFLSDGYLVYEQRHAIHNDFEYEKYYIDEDKYNAMQPFKVVPGDLLVSCSGVTLGRIAEVPIYAKKGIINQALLKITLNQNVMTNKYFMELFRNEEIQDHLFGFSRGSGIPNFPSMNEVKEVEFLCPPIELQQKYCDFLRQVDKMKLNVQKSLNETQKLFDSLIQEYFG